MRGLEQIPWLYDALFALIDRTGLGKWRKWLATGAQGRTLEVGCGTGRNLGFYPPGVHAIGLELSADNLRAARRRSPATPLVRATAEALPFRDGVFQTVVSSLVFCSVPKPGVGLAEVRRVLSGDGQLRMLEHVRARGRFKARAQDAVQPAWTWATGGCHPNRQTVEAVQAAGFRIEENGRRENGDMRRFSARKGT